MSLFKTVGFGVSVGLSLLIAALYILSRPEIGILPTPGILESLHLLRDVSEIVFHVV